MAMVVEAAAKCLIESKDIAFLPQELFQMILSDLDPVDIVRCRRVSRAWSNAFGNPRSLIPVLKQTFASAREVRDLVGNGRFDDLSVLPDSNIQFWRDTFNKVAARYYRLACGKPRSIQRLKLCEPYYLGTCQFFQVAPWDHHASHCPEWSDLMFEHAFWTYDDGLVVFPSDEDRSIVLLDLETNETFLIPFILTNKVVRRIRLKDRLLVIEWAEPDAFHWLNDSDGVHRHFAIAFDIRKYGRGWEITFRNEWKIMFLGHPLGERDRFFSTHNNKNYAIYIWQPNRSLYTADEDAPIESLFVWDISQASSYRPSSDPTGRVKETMGDEGPIIIARFSFRELGFYSVRQRGFPAITRLDVNSEANTVDITEVTYTTLSSLGLNSYNPLEWGCKARTISIPFVGYGPCWRYAMDVSLPLYRGNSCMESPPLTMAGNHPWYLGVYEATDEDAQVAYCIRFNYNSPMDENRIIAPLVVTIHTPLSVTTLSDSASDELSKKGKICGDERFVIGENSKGELVIYRFG